MTTRELLRVEASDLDIRAAAADRLTGNESAGAIAEKAHEVDALRSRAAALRAIADRFDAEIAAAEEKAKLPWSKGRTKALLARLDAPVTK